MFKRLKSNYNSIKNHSIKISGSIFSFIGILSIFVDFSKYFTNSLSIIICFLLVALVSVGSSVLLVFLMSRKTIHKTPTNKKVILRYANIFEANENIKIIPVNRCFDTEISEFLISEKSLQGQLINKILENTTKEDLNNRISIALSNREYKTIEWKQYGKKEEYQCGEIAKIVDSGSTYYLLALTEINKEYKTICTIDEYVESFSRLIDHLDMCQGKIVEIPLIGANFARMNVNKKELLDFMIAIIKLKQNKLMCEEVHIVIHEKLKSEISIANL